MDNIQNGFILIDKYFKIENTSNFSNVQIFPKYGSNLKIPTNHIAIINFNFMIDRRTSCFSSPIQPNTYFKFYVYNVNTTGSYECGKFYFPRVTNDFLMNQKGSIFHISTKIILKENEQLRLDFYKDPSLGYTESYASFNCSGYITNS